MISEMWEAEVQVEDFNEGLKYLGCLLKKKLFHEWLALAFCKIGELFKKLVLLMVVQGLLPLSCEIDAWRYTSILDVTLLDTQRNFGEGSHDVF